MKHKSYTPCKQKFDPCQTPSLKLEWATLNLSVGNSCGWLFSSIQFKLHCKLYPFGGKSSWECGIMPRALGPP